MNTGLGKLHLQLLNVIFLVDDVVRCHRFRGLARSCTQHRFVELSNCRVVRRQRMVNLVTYNRHACRPHCSRQCLGGSRAVVGVLVPAPRLATRRNHQLQHVQCPGFVRLRGAKASRGGVTAVSSSLICKSASCSGTIKGVGTNFKRSFENFQESNTPQKAIAPRRATGTDRAVGWGKILSRV